MLPSKSKPDAPLFADDDDEDLSSPSRMSPWKVLVVDDEDDVLTVTKLVLASFTFDGRRVELIPACSGIEARTLLAQHSDIAVAFIDVVMELFVYV